MRIAQRLFLTLLSCLAGLLQAEQFDVVVVGAGIGGLTTALRATDAGLRVGVVDMSSVFGGHALMSSGGLCIVGTPLQKEKGIEDSPEIAYQDFLRLGEDANEPMVRLYVDRSRELIYDWLTGLGVRFNSVSSGGMGDTGNSADRFHMNPQLGYGLVSPIYRQCLKQGVTFVWNTKITGLVSKGGRVRGVTGTNLRTGARVTIHGQAVVLATGGFESNQELVRTYWPKYLQPTPERVVLGSGANSQGSGLTLATGAGGALRNMDHQWIYPRGIPDPHHLAEGRGLYAMVPNAIALNRDGMRFMDEMSSTVQAVRKVVAQPGGTYWLLFDDAGAQSVFAVGMDWQDRKKVRREIVDNDEVVKTAATVEEVARMAGLPSGTVLASVASWNTAVETGVDEKFGRKLTSGQGPNSRSSAAKIERGPFHLMQIFPLSRKSMGGIAVDLNGRVLRKSGTPIEGLYAVGEATGEGGLNGRSALEGTFLGPSIVQGHMAALHLSKTILPSGRGVPADAAARGPEGGKALTADCGQCHNMPQLVAAKRQGYWHFEKLHAVVASRKVDCKGCHAEMSPYRAGAHRIDRLAQIQVCITCHLVAE